MLDCVCPVGASLEEIVVPTCVESVGQIQKVIFMRRAASPILLTEVAEKASMVALTVADDDSKIVISPFIENPEMTPGDPVTFGGGNQTLNGEERIIGRNASLFTASINEAAQIETIKPMKKLSCEKLKVFFVDAYGRLTGITATTTIAGDSIDGIPVSNVFVGDKKVGGLAEPDSNALRFNLPINWSDNLKIVKPDFNPLEEL